MHDSGEDRLGNRVRDVVVAWFPALVCFVLIPLAVYLPNQREYDYDVTVILPFLGVAVAVLVLLCPLALVRSSLRTKIAIVLFYLGAFVALSDMLAPAPLTLLEDYSKLDQLDEPLRLTLIQLALAVGLLICLWKLPGRIVRDVAFILVLGVLVSEGATVVANLSWRSNLASLGTPVEPTVRGGAGQKAPAKTGNIYQLIFDGYSGCKFLEAAERLGADKSFAGFTFFQKARSSYIYTPLSYTNFMTATLFDGRSLQGWQDGAVDAGLVEKLYQSGYTIWFYPVGLRYVHKRASHVRPPDEKAWLNTNFLRVCIIRIAPNPIRQEANTILRNMGSAMREEEQSSDRDAGRPAPGESVPGAGRCCSSMTDFLRDEADRPAHGQYVYFHIMLPHPPLLYDCQCNPSAHATYEDNACCAARLMTELIKRLKDLGRFEDSLIILQSDHGWQLEGNECNAADSGGIPPEVARTIKSSTNGALTPKEFLDRTHPMLLVKPPHAPDRSLVLSSVPAQLSDIPATIIDLEGISGGFPGGKNLFDLGPQESREVHFFSGFKQAGKNGGLLVLGKHVRSGRLGHFSYTAGSGWKVYPDVSVRSGTGWFSH
jgi:hypothetical protein